MEQHSIYYDCSAKEATARHWRKYCLINFLEIVVIVLICVWTIFSEGEFIIRLIWEAIFVFAVTIVTNILIGFNANQFVYILFQDCDPQKMYEAMRFLEIKETKKSSKNDHYLHIAQSCLSCEGKLDEGFEYLQKVNYKKKNFLKEVSYYGELANYAYWQKDRESFDKIKKEFTLLPSQVKKYSKIELKNYKKIEDYILLKEYLWDEKESEARALINELLSQEVFQINKVTFHMHLARLDLKKNEYTNAKMHLDYVIKYGNTMKAVKEAKELLQEIATCEE